MVVAVGEDHVARPDQGGDRAGVGGKAGGEQQGRLGPLELGQRFLQLPVAVAACR